MMIQKQIHYTIEISIGQLLTALLECLLICLRISATMMSIYNNNIVIYYCDISLINSIFNTKMHRKVQCFGGTHRVEKNCFHFGKVRSRINVSCHGIRSYRYIDLHYTLYIRNFYIMLGSTTENQLVHACDIVMYPNFCTW